MNYLAYTWIEHGVNQDQALDMLHRAVELREDDGYIVDSLGWAYYRRGDFAKAVKYLERAILLEPGEATINDHLGDAFWRVGRQLEARFQWSHALRLKPEEKDVARIERKLAVGLDVVEAEERARGKTGS
jgi:Flp pilus assembly protein TadD